MTGLSVIVPCYNEDSRGSLTDRINSLLIEIKKLQVPFEIICIDDGSTDNTYKTLLAIDNISIVGYKGNRGKGYAIRYGLDYCIYDRVLITDADMSVPLDNIKYFYDIAGENKCIIGVRQYNHKSRPLFRRFLTYMSKLCVHKVLNLSVTDSQCGFKLFNLEDYQSVSKYIKSERWVFDMELLTYFSIKGVSIYEVPVKWNNVLKSTIKGLPALKSSLVEFSHILRSKRAYEKEIKLL